MVTVVNSPVKFRNVVLWQGYEPVVSFFEKFKGLMLRSKINFPLLFTFSHMSKWSIHSCFCNFEFDAIFLNEEKKIVTIARKVTPWTLSITSKNCKYLIECNVNESNSLREGDILEW